MRLEEQERFNIGIYIEEIECSMREKGEKKKEKIYFSVIIVKYIRTHGSNTKDVLAASI